MYTIYSITNDLNGRKYVGLTKHSAAHRFMQHVQSAVYVGSNCPLHRAIRKHGPDNFSIETLQDCIEHAFSRHRKGIQGCLQPVWPMRFAPLPVPHRAERTAILGIRTRRGRV